MAGIPAPTFIRTHDGERLAVFEMGRTDGPTLLLVNGLGGNLAAWVHIIPRFADRFRIISFDYRGMYQSPPALNRDYSMNAHAGDAIAVLDHFRTRKAVVMGWSMGVQVCLEVYRRAARRVAALILANGAYGRPMDRGVPGLKQGSLAVMKALARTQHLLRPLASPFLRNTLPVKAAKAAGLVSQRLDEQVFLALAGDFIHLDFDAYSLCVNTLLDHDATDVLDTITVPTLIVSGGRDVFTPAAMAEEMVRRIRTCSHLHLPDASHYAAVEYPEEIAGAMTIFLNKEIHMDHTPLPGAGKRRGTR
jgi:pimeloyl-ACP methyl ester carboxylesterase